MSQLLNFYFGTQDEAQRLKTERELLEDPEALVAYLDLKRELEQAVRIPALSAALRTKLRARLETKAAKIVIPLSIGLALAAGLAATLMVRAPVQAPQKQILFDGRVEPSAVTGVL